MLSAPGAVYVMWIALIIFNGSVIFMLRFLLANANLTSMLREKSLPPPPPPPADGSAAAPATDTSFSRVAGAIGAVVLACFFWAIGTVVIYDEFAAPDQVQGIVEGIGKFLLSGAALFAPYAVNQLTAIFKQ